MQHLLRSSLQNLTNGRVSCARPKYWRHLRHGEQASSSPGPKLTSPSKILQKTICMFISLYICWDYSTICRYTHRDSHSLQYSYKNCVNGSNGTPCTSILLVYTVLVQYLVKAEKLKQILDNYRIHPSSSICSCSLIHSWICFRSVHWCGSHAPQTIITDISLWLANPRPAIQPSSTIWVARAQSLRASGKTARSEDPHQSQDQIHCEADSCGFLLLFRYRVFLRQHCLKKLSNHCAVGLWYIFCGSAV